VLLLRKGELCITEFIVTWAPKLIKQVKSFYRPEGAQEVKAPRFRDNGAGWW